MCLAEKGENPKPITADLLRFILFNSHERKLREKWFESGVSEGKQECDQGT